jgi:hypothetical protein
VDSPDWLATAGSIQEQFLVADSTSRSMSFRHAQLAESSQHSVLLSLPLHQLPRGRDGVVDYDISAEGEQALNKLFLFVFAIRLSI